MNRPIVFWLGVVALAVVFLTLSPSHVTAKHSDQLFYEDTVERMQRGEDYYSAMDAALFGVTQAPLTQIRSFRLPTVFIIWRYVGLSWPLAFVVLVGSGYLTMRLTTPIVGLAMAAYLVRLAHPVGGLDYAWVEFWALPLVLAAMLAIRDDRWTAACICAFGAAAIRELAAPLVVSGLIAALIFDRPWKPWALATGTYVGLFAIHAHLAATHIAPSGFEGPLVGTGGSAYLFDMAAPALGVFGFAAVAWAFWRGRFTAEWWLVGPLVIGIPLLGLVMGRSYWGILVFPIAIPLLWADRQRPPTRTRDVIRLPESEIVAPREPVGQGSAT